MVLKVVYAIPVIGWMLREAIEGPVTAKILFLVNLVMVWILAIIMFGYPAIILPALVLVPTMFTILILITNG